jgi:glycogen debranching enzyme
MAQEVAELPSFEESKGVLPDPHWDGHDSAIQCYWKTWQFAFSNLRKLAPESGFVANYIDTAFNDCIFMWDSCFILMFGRYGTRAFDFLRTLDNFYAKQHKDGFICREIGQKLGDDRFSRFDPTSTGPGLMPWTEWEYYLNFGDKERLAKIFPALIAYHQWMRDYRTWPDGSYWASGFASGMDNQPRLGDNMPPDVERFYHGHMVWADTCFQQILSANLIARVAAEIGRESDAVDLTAEATQLKRFVNRKLWDDESQFYYDLRKGGTLNGVKSIGAYWALSAGAVAPKRLDSFIAHLDNPCEFKRAHRIPSLSADHREFNPNGGYWKGGVWPPTNYMVLRGLTSVGRHALAYEIGRNHHDAVVKTFEETESVFENYAPEYNQPGQPARKDFVGWGGVPPIAVFLEYVLGLKADVPHRKLVWDVNLLEAHGVKRYPFGKGGLVDLRCEARSSAMEEPRITAKSNVPLSLEVRWTGDHKTLRLKP